MLCLTRRRTAELWRNMSLSMALSGTMLVNVDNVPHLLSERLVKHVG